MFAFGTNDFGTPRCDSNGFCKCLCEIGATKEGFCHQMPHNGYRLYRFGAAGILLPWYLRQHENYLTVTGRKIRMNSFLYYVRMGD